MEVSFSNFFINPNFFLEIDYRINKLISKEINIILHKNKVLREIEKDWVFSINVIFDKGNKSINFFGPEIDKRNKYYNFRYQIPFSSLEKANDLNDYVQHCLRAIRLIFQKWDKDYLFNEYFLNSQIQIVNDLYKLDIKDLLVSL